MISEDTKSTFGLISCTPSWVFAPPNERSCRAPEGFTGIKGPSNNSLSDLKSDILLWHLFMTSNLRSDVCLRRPIWDQISCETSNLRSDVFLGRPIWKKGKQNPFILFVCDLMSKVFQVWSKFRFEIGTLYPYNLNLKLGPYTVHVWFEVESFRCGQKM